MSTEIIIYILIGVVIVVAAHVLLHRLLKFKMDESAIVKFLQGFENEDKYQTNTAISTAVNISIPRVAVVCEKSEHITHAAEDTQTWAIKNDKKT
ncbi:hypothetical protein [Paraglaciecola sp.]|uniref:hypothetical protein n=1 Tax=Paraglaciecola sp. TaxID=1920173 RepID=UPI003EF5615A